MPPPLTVVTPLGPGFFTPREVNVREGVSELFLIQLSLEAENTKEVAFDKLLGEKVSVVHELAGGKKR